MKRTDKPDLPLTEDGRYRLLVEAVTDFAIYMLEKCRYGCVILAGRRK
jgi:hypothetical protein